MWFAYNETMQWTVALDAPEPISKAHPALSQWRTLAGNEMTSFSVVQSAEAAGPIAADRLEPEDRLFVEGRAKLQPRLERAAHQQFLKLAILRRDARFEICGTEGVLVLSGNTLLGARTTDAVRPIRRRLIAWATIVLALAFAMALVTGSLVGQTAYFQNARQWSSALWLLSIGFVISPVGGLLRAWRGGLRMHTVRKTEKGLAALAACAFAAMVAVGLVARPSPKQVEAALAAGNAAKAREVIDALKEVRGATPPVLEVEDHVAIAEAAAGAVHERLRLLDSVAAGGRSKAVESAATARRLRVDELARLVANRQPSEALQEIARWFPAQELAAPDIAELTAKAHGLKAEACTDEPCRYSETKAAYEVRPEPERATALNGSRARLLASLDERATGDTLSKLQQARKLGTLAASTLAAADDDDAVLAESANAAARRAKETRDRVALIGSERAVVGELLSGMREVASDIAATTVDGSDVFAVFDGKNMCRGLYVVGRATAGRAVLPETASKILEQALGRPVALREQQTGGIASVSWSEGSVRMLARWLNQRLLELRIGDANP